jgi:hypothetical protein
MVAVPGKIFWGYEFDNEGLANSPTCDCNPFQMPLIPRSYVMPPARHESLCGFLATLIAQLDKLSVYLENTRVPGHVQFPVRCNNFTRKI